MCGVIFGFDGKEKTDEVTGITGVTYDYGYRIYDTRIAKFLSVDPLTASYPWYTPYQFAGNKPIENIDIDGLEEFSFKEHMMMSAGRPEIGLMNYLGDYLSNNSPRQVGTDIAASATNADLMSSTATNLYGYCQTRADKAMNRGKEVGIAISENRDPSEVEKSYQYKENQYKIALTGDAIGWLAIISEAGQASLNTVISTASGPKNGIPEGFSKMAKDRPGEWYTKPRTLRQKLGLEEAMSGGGMGNLKATHGTGATKALKDPKLRGKNFTKYEYTRAFTDPKTKKIVDKFSIHYYRNNETGATFDFKFKEIGY